MIKASSLVTAPTKAADRVAEVELFGISVQLDCVKLFYKKKKVKNMENNEKLTEILKEYLSKCSNQDKDDSDILRNLLQSAIEIGLETLPHMAVLNELNKQSSALIEKSLAHASHMQDIQRKMMTGQVRFSGI